MGKYLADDVGIFDAGESLPRERSECFGYELHGIAAGLAGFDIDAEYALKPPGPCQPIIEQDVVRVNHEDSVEDMIRKGRDLEKMVLARAIRHHLHHNILVYENRTVVFE
jgi:hypothetical protein